MLTTHVAEMIAQARSRVRNLSAAQVADALAGGDVVLVDVREAAERDNGTIAGSIHVPRGMLEFHADEASPYHLDVLDPTRRIIVFCASGGRSALAADSLQHMGYTDVAHLDGGYNSWPK
jgi:rhodanese-related sulfurtransferase